MTDIAADPFRERPRRMLRRVLEVIGATVCFESNDRALLAIAEQAFTNLPAHRLGPAVPLTIALVLDGTVPRRRVGKPERMRLASGAGLLTGNIDGLVSVTIAPAERRALVIVSRAMLKFRYHLRYEIIEFVTLTLAARARGLMPLHAACVARADRAVLLLGDSGAGMSTLALLAAADGLALVAEDSVFVAPDTLRATGAPNYLHVRVDSLRHVDPPLRARIRHAPVIERRSGVRKHAFDLRGSGRLAPRPPRIAAVVVVSAERARGPGLLRPLARDSLRRALRITQPYARGQPGWASFERRILRLPAWRIERGDQPADSLAALRDLLRGRP